MMNEQQTKCFACDRVTRNPKQAITEDSQIVDVGADCYSKITRFGWQSPKGGPKLWRLPEHSR